MLQHYEWYEHYFMISYDTLHIFIQYLSCILQLPNNTKKNNKNAVTKINDISIHTCYYNKCPSLFILFTHTRDMIQTILYWGAFFPLFCLSVFFTQKLYVLVYFIDLIKKLYTQICSSYRTCDVLVAKEIIDFQLLKLKDSHFITFLITILYSKLLITNADLI